MAPAVPRGRRPLKRPRLLQLILRSTSLAIQLAVGRHQSTTTRLSSLRIHKKMCGMVLAWLSTEPEFLLRRCDRDIDRHHSAI